MQTIHWLRYGCLPVFVIEGRTPAAKLDKLRARWAGGSHGNCMHVQQLSMHLHSDRATSSKPLKHGTTTGTAVLQVLVASHGCCAVPPCRLLGMFCCQLAANCSALDMLRCLSKRPLHTHALFLMLCAGLQVCRPVWTLQLCQ